MLDKLRSACVSDYDILLKPFNPQPLCPSPKKDQKGSMKTTRRARRAAGRAEQPVENENVRKVSEVEAEQAVLLKMQVLAVKRLRNILKKLLKTY